MGAQPVSRDQLLRREQGQGKFIFPVQMTRSRSRNLTPFEPSLLNATIIHHVDTHARERQPNYFPSLSRVL